MKALDVVTSDVDLLVIGGACGPGSFFSAIALLIDALGIARRCRGRRSRRRSPAMPQDRRNRARATQQQRILRCARLRWPCALSIGAVLVGDAGIVARRRHAVMAAELLVAARQVLCRLGGRDCGRPPKGCRCGARAVPPPSDHRAFCSASARATKLSPPSTTWACSKPATASGSDKAGDPAPAGDRGAGIADLVKSERPIRPGGCSWRKITLRSGPFTARHVRMRRSSVRRVPEPSSGCRRHSSSKTAIGRNPGAALSIGRTSSSQTPLNGSARRRSRGAFLEMEVGDLSRTGRRLPC